MPPMVAREEVEMSTGNHSPCGLSRPVELVEHDAGLDHAAAPGDVELEHAVEMLRAVDDQRGIDGLAGLRGAPAARQRSPPRAPAPSACSASVIERGITTPTGITW